MAKTVSFRPEKDIIDKLEKLALKKDRSVAYIISEIVTKALTPKK